MKVFITRRYNLKTELIKVNNFKSICVVAGFGLCFYYAFTIYIDDFNDLYEQKNLTPITKKQYYAVIRYLNSHDDYTKLYNI